MVNNLRGGGVGWQEESGVCCRKEDALGGCGRVSGTLVGFQDVGKERIREDLLVPN